MKKYILPAVIVLLLGSGCFFSRGSALKVVHYQPELSLGNKPVCSLRTGAVSNISGAGREFVKRDSGSAVKIVPEKRWLNSPEVMLKSAMLMNFTGGSDADAVSAQIIRFEFSSDFKMLDAAAEIVGVSQAESFILEIGERRGYAKCENHYMSEVTYKRCKAGIKRNIAVKLYLTE